MIIQIYEIQTPAEAERCIELGVNQLGSVLLSEEHWKVATIHEVGVVARRNGIKHSIIPLFRNPEAVFKVIDFYNPAYIHFCDNMVADDGRLLDNVEELLELQVAVKEKFAGVNVMRAVPIPRHDLNFEEFPWEAIARRFEPVSDAFLIDTWVPHHMTPVPEFVGITGKLANRAHCQALVRATGTPVILAGGLSPENVYDAVVEVVPAGADSCTLTNEVGSDGKPIRFAKDMKRVAAFCAEVLRAKEALARS